MAPLRSSISRHGLPLLAGALFPLGLAPFDFWPATLLSLSLFYLAQRTREASFVTGWLFGAGLFLCGASWIFVSINVYGDAPVPLAGLLTLCFCLGLALLHGVQVSLFARFGSTSQTWAPVSFASLWVLFEWLRSWLLTGFPWLYAGYTALDSPLRGWVPVIGVYGTGFLIAGLAASLSGVLSTRASRGSVILTACFLALWAAGPLLAEKNWSQPDGERVSLAVYQPNIPLEKKWDRRYFFPILDQYANATAGLYEDADIVLWPESALPAYQDQLGDYLEDQSRLAARGNATLITGIPMRIERDRHNSIMALGQGSGVHHKQKLVPFGEYVPLEQWLRGVIAFFDLPMSSFVPGADATPRLKANNHVIAPFICYEIVYPDFVLNGARDASIIVTVSNDSWFGRSIGPLQHLQMAQYRALETGKPVIRGTNNGVSAIINEKGDLISRSEQFQEEVLLGTIQPYRGETPLTRFAPFIPWSLAALFLTALFFRKHSDRADPD
ncbi:MAG: apolipoprotein N-acyltransferase [Luminiphilus sp.]